MKQVTQAELEKIALELIYAVDYDIGKENDPEVYGEEYVRDEKSGNADMQRALLKLGLVEVKQGGE